MTQPVARLLVAWMVFCALWLSALLIYTAVTRPAPPFLEVASLLVGVPALLLVAGLWWERHKR
jgi:hypothetical protein